MSIVHSRRPSQRQLPPAIMEAFDSQNTELQSFVVSVYIVGFVFGPLATAPLSELYGRSIILNTTNALFFVFTIACALSTNLAMFIVFRLLVGLMACTPLTLGGGYIADVMPADGRGRAMSIWSMGPLLVCCPTPLLIRLLLLRRSV